MYLHLGNSIIISSSEIIGIFDMDKSTVSRDTKEFLNRKQKDGAIISSDELGKSMSYSLPKSYIVTSADNKEKVYLSPLSATTLNKRLFKKEGYKF